MSLVTIYRPKTKWNSVIQPFLFVVQVDIFQYLFQLKYCIQQYSDTMRSCTPFDHSGHVTS